ncbi:peptidase [Microbacterium sp. P02]|uniref:peptidase n=1 Tax=Microbacterium sp. P02 TaxID=3366260 RepID=UPI0036718871
MVIDWWAFVQVFAAALVGSVLVVGFYSLGLRLLVLAGRVPVVAPAEFTDAITVISPTHAQRAEKRAAKAARKNPLTDGQKRLALLGAWGCFALCAIAVLSGLLLIVWG